MDKLNKLSDWFLSVWDAAMDTWFDLGDGMQLAITIGAFIVGWVLGAILT